MPRQPGLVTQTLLLGPQLTRRGGVMTGAPRFRDTGRCVQMG